MGDSSLREHRTLIYVDKGNIIIEPFPGDPLKTPDEVVREPYNEVKEEKKAKRWLKKHAGR